MEDLEVLQEPQVPTLEEIQAEQEKIQAEEEAAEKELDDIIIILIKKAEDEDKDLRTTPLNIWKRNTLYFNNIQNIFLDPVAQDYRTLNTLLDELTKEGVNIDIKVINVYRAYIESIVAALSVEVPAIEFTPDDATNPDDIDAAKTYEKISILVQKHNHSALMLIKALVIFCNQGVVFGHNYYDTNPAYGVISKPSRIETKASEAVDIRCQFCGTLLDSDVPPELNAEGSNVSCPECGFQGPPEIAKRLVYSNEVVQWENTPKGRSKFDIYGPTYIKAPLYAREQSRVGYLIFRDEHNIAFLKTKWNNYDLSDKHDSESYERWARLPIEYNNTVPQHIATERQCFFRPWYYNELSEDLANILFEKYPNGLKATIIGDTVVDKKSNNLDDQWTISFDPRADYLHAEPLGNAAVPIQDAENDTFNLGLQSIEYGVPETFVHPKTVNLRKYRESNAAPGMMTAAMPYSPEKSLSDGFHTIKTATLSGEYTAFEKGLENKGQFVTGAMASIFGGGNAAGSRTADEYRQSRAQALQRLQIPNRTIKVFWPTLIFKCVRDYARNLKEDENYTEKKGGSWINVWIEKSALTGKVGQVEPDMNEELPQSWPQKRDFVSQMLEKAPEAVGTILFHPNNAEFLKKYTGMSEIYIPGEVDQDKQTREFYELIQSGPAGNQSSVPVDVDVDDHNVHKLVLKNILVSPIGLNLNPDAYANCIAHYREHEFAEQAKMMSMGSLPAGQGPPTAIDKNEGV